jgi:hypothetical protein
MVEASGTRRKNPATMIRRARRTLGAAMAAGIGGGLAVVLAGAFELPAEGAGGADGGVMSTFVAHAQRGEVVPPDIDDVEHMCALLTACDRLPIPPGLVPPEFATCVKKFSDELTSPEAITFSLTMRECGLQSNSCAALRACALHGASADACQGRGHQSVVGLCDVDGRAISCWHDEVLAVRDCGRGGEQCIVAGGDAKCTLGPCPGTIKDGDAPQCSASGTHKLQCEKGKLVSLDCAAFGLRCDSTGGVAGCATSGAPCASGAKRCDGNVAVGCVNGHEVRVDCSSAGLSCSAGGGGNAVGACAAAPPANGACDPSEKPRCDGASIKYCSEGKARSYFCKSLGFGRCESKGGPHCAM